MQTFNVGDKVKVVKLDNRIWVKVRKRLGQIGTVIKSNQTDCQIEFEDGKRFLFHSYQLEKAEEDFKIGEEVYVNTNIYTDEKFKIVAITEFHIVVKDKKELIYHFDRKFVSKQPINPKSDNQAEKIMNKTPEQIDSEIKDLETKINSLKQEKESQTFEVGDWVVCLKNTLLGFYTKDKLYEIIKFDRDDLLTRFNNYSPGECSISKSNCRKATPAEIEAHLIKLAEESGLKIGGNVPGKEYLIENFKISNGVSNSCSCEKYIRNNKLKYCLKIIYNDSNYNIPFDYISYLSQKFQPKITINGYDAEFCEGFVKFGCAKFDNDIFHKVKEFINFVSDNKQFADAKKTNCFTNRQVESIKLGAGIFTPTDIENIVKRLKD